MKEERIDALLQNARAGDQDAFTALYNATSQDVYQTIRSMVRSEQLALDIQQEVYIRAFSRLDQLGDPSKFPSWLRVIAVNQTRTELKKRTPILFTELEREDGPEIPEISDDRPERLPELVLEQKETAELVQEILGSLTDSQRLLVGMYYYEQIPVTKIAQDLNLSPGTVKTQLSRSRRKVETRVRALEEKGVKLYGLSPMPFLLALLKRLRPAEKAEKQVLADALTESGVAETAMIRVGTGFFHAVAGKLLAGLTAVAIIGGGIAGFSWYRNRKTAPTVGDVQLINTVNQTDNPSISEDSSMQTEPQNGTSEETEEVIVTREDSPEDMTETPTEPPTEFPTELSTEAPTEPPTEPPTNPVGADDHIGPAPEPTSPQPTNPTPADPIVSSDPTNPTNPADPPTEPPIDTSDSEPTGEEPMPVSGQVTNCTWSTSGSQSLYDQEWGKPVYVYAQTTFDCTPPTLYTDRPDLVTIIPEGHFSKISIDSGFIEGYRWKVSISGPGTANLYCMLGEENTHVLTVENPEHPDRIIRTEPSESPEDRLINLKQTLTIDTFVEGLAVPELHSDNPDVIRVDNERDRRELFGATFIEGVFVKSNWANRFFRWSLQPASPGIAHLTLTLNGEVQKSWTVQIKSFDNSSP